MMAVKRRYILHQLPVLASLGRTALAAARGGTGGARPDLPSAEIRAVLPPRPADLVRDYIRECGGDPRGYRGQLPPHLFSHWGFPLAARTLRGIPYPLARVLNGGCRLEVNGPLPADQPIVASARLESIDDDGRRAVLCQRVASGVEGDPERVVATLYAIVPLQKKGEDDRASNGKRERPRVPTGADEIAFFRLRRDAGLSFALLTGDFNPVHWSTRYARSAGFGSTILHGFATMARAYEGVIRNRFAGDTSAIRVFDVKFTRPLILPADVGLYVSRPSSTEAKGNHRVFVGAAPGGPAYMVGELESRTPSKSNAHE